ncbi:hypothetical protein ACTOWA_00605 [Herbaspirillum seropedicae]|uniref:hypothetical protein n=1 Tax=Herbaspirillum seropedicae TaxID=964 RepID=UPI003F8D6E5D
MGGMVTVMVRTEDRRQYSMGWGTTALRNITMKGWLTMDPDFCDWQEAFARWSGAELKAPFSPDGYGLVVVDHVSKFILSRQNHTDLGLVNSPEGIPADLGSFQLDQKPQATSQEWSEIFVRLQELGFEFGDEDRRMWQRWQSRRRADEAYARLGLPYEAKKNAIWLADGDPALAAKLLRISEEELFELNTGEADECFCGRPADWRPADSLGDGPWRRSAEEAAAIFGNSNTMVTMPGPLQLSA